MKISCIKSITPLILLICFCQEVYSQQNADQPLIAKVDSALSKLVGIQKEIKTIHPFLQTLHPIAIVEGDDLFIFDFDSSAQKYQFQKKEPVPFPLSKGIRASFPLSSYSGKPSCIVSKEVFDSLNGYATIFHEFMHCNQSLTCEYKLKEKLKIAQVAAQKNDYSWEINHGFPYEDSVFVVRYSNFLKALENNNPKAIKESRVRLKQHLSQVDYEYLVWEEWKEGFARLIENKIRSKYNLEKNGFGKEQPYNRVTFYYGGENFISHITKNESGKFFDVEELFVFMLDYGQ